MIPRHKKNAIENKCVVKSDQNISLQKLAERESDINFVPFLFLVIQHF